jgi:rod shape-determining protein MreD
MSFWRVVIAALLVITSLLLQVVVINRLRLPGAPPELLFIVVLSLALLYGPLGGAILGFSAGLLADVMPPADHQLGRYAIVLCFVAYLAGVAKSDVQRSAFGPLLVVVLGSAFATLLYVGMGAVLSDTRVTWSALAHNVPASVLYDLLLAPFLVPAVLALARRFEPAPVRW